MPPCRVVKSGFIPTPISIGLPDRASVAISAGDLENVLRNYGIKDCPPWVREARLGKDEIVVFYPRAVILGTGPLQGSLFPVWIKKTGDNGVGVALLRGDVNPTPWFNEE